MNMHQGNGERSQKGAGAVTGGKGWMFFPYLPPVIHGEEVAMRTLIDLLNHGTLPFVGRGAEIERIVAFWRGTFDASELRAALMIGETGIGKSRLIEEAIRPIRAAGGAVVHMRVYPESTTSLVAIASRALRSSDTGGRLLKKEPEALPETVAAAFRRLSRLRPTLLVVEDIHLLSGESLREFTLLLHSLADDTLSVLCAARPVEMEGRGPLERFLVEEIRLEGLDETELQRLWHELFESPPEPDLLRALAGSTAGNPLALRSALRGAVRSEAIRFDERSNGWRTELSAASLARSLKRSVDLLAEGMAAHLTPQERRAAEELASLGEVFAMETADRMIEGAERMIEVLTFRGIVAAASTATPPLAGRGSDHPLLAFTHSLLHTHLLDASHPDPGLLARAIAGNLPLYSILPFRLVAAGADDLPLSGEERRAAIERALNATYLLDIGPDWELSLDAWNAAQRLIESPAALWTDEERLDQTAQLLIRKIIHLRRRINSPEHEELVDRLLELTEGPIPEELRHHRLSALRYLYWREFHRDQSRCREIWERMEELLQGHPPLRFRIEYIGYLGNVAQAARSISDKETLRLVEKRYNDLLASHEAGDALRLLARESITPHLLSLFDSPEELQERLRMADELTASPTGSQITFRMLRIGLLESIGRLDETLQACDDALRQSKDQGLDRNVLHCSLVRICCKGAFGADLAECEREARALREEARAKGMEAFGRNAGIYLCEVGVLRNDPAWTARIAEEFLGGHERLWPENRIMLASAAGNLAGIVDDLPDEDELGALLKRLASAAVGRTEISTRDLIDAALPALRRAPMRKDDLVALHAILTLIDLGSGFRPELASELESERRTALVRALEWLAAHGLVAYMRPFVERYEGLLPKKEATSWRSRMQSLTRERARRLGNPTGRRVKVSMLGTITVERPDGETRNLGSRLRTLLGLMVADTMLENPLSHREFIRIAAGEEAEQEHARKTMNTGVLRLREAMGQDAILTDGETPRLNPEVLTVDLLKADEALKEAAAALRDRTLLRAYPAVLRALEITAGEVPFPTLYDELFEAAREEFEIRLRDAVIDVSRELLHEGDAESAREILRRSFDSMPDDEEIAELLRDTLAAMGRHVEAERVIMKSREAAEID